MSAKPTSLGPALVTIYATRGPNRELIDMTVSFADGTTAKDMRHCAKILKAFGKELGPAGVVIKIPKGEGEVLPPKYEVQSMPSYDYPATEASFDTLEEAQEWVQNAPPDCGYQIIQVWPLEPGEKT